MYVHKGRVFVMCLGRYMVFLHMYTYLYLPKIFSAKYMTSFLTPLFHIKSSETSEFCFKDIKATKMESIFCKRESGCSLALVIFLLPMAPHSRTLAWKIPWTEEPGRLQSMGLLRVG